MPDRKITGFPFKHAGLPIPYPTHTSKGNCTTSCVVTLHLIVALWGHAEFRSGYHTQILTDGRKDIQQLEGKEAEEDFSPHQGYFHQQKSSASAAK